VPNAALVSADKIRTMTIPSPQKINNLQIPLSSCADRHEVQIRCFKPVESRIAGSNNIALLLLAWSTRRASQSAAPSGLHLGHVRPLGGRLKSPVGQLLVGERFTVADATVASFFLGMQEADAAPDPKRWPNLARYIQQQYARPTIARLIEQEAAVMATNSP
jgi:hypothetical protein